MSGLRVALRPLLMALAFVGLANFVGFAAEHLGGDFDQWKAVAYAGIVGFLCHRIWSLPGGNTAPISLPESPSLVERGRGN